MTDVMRSISRPRMVQRFASFEAANDFALTEALNLWAEQSAAVGHPVRVIAASIAKFDGGLVALITYERPE